MRAAACASRDTTPFDVCDLPRTAAFGTASTHPFETNYPHNTLLPGPRRRIHSRSTISTALYPLRSRRCALSNCTISARFPLSIWLLGPHSFGLYDTRSTLTTETTYICVLWFPPHSAFATDDVPILIAQLLHNLRCLSGRRNRTFSSATTPAAL